MNSKIKKFVLMVIIITAMIFVSAFSMTVFAEETGTETNTSQSAENGSNSGGNAEGEELIEVEENGGETIAESGTNEEETIAESFLEYLKTVYPSNYEYYYNLIIDNWGSVEEYLLSIEMPTEESQNSWEKFVGWLSEYASVWATILAGVVVVIFAYVQHCRTQKYKAQYTTLTEASNQQSEALLAVIAAQKALLGNNAKFSEEAAALEEAEKELKTDV